MVAEIGVALMVGASPLEQADVLGAMIVVDGRPYIVSADCLDDYMGVALGPAGPYDLCIQPPSQLVDEYHHIPFKSLQTL